MLRDNHEKHIACYGSGNKARLIGKCEAPSWQKFSYGVGNRGVSIQIPISTQTNQRIMTYFVIIYCSCWIILRIPEKGE